VRKTVGRDELLMRVISHAKFEQQGVWLIGGNGERRMIVELMLDSIVYVYGNEKIVDMSHLHNY
jgi:rRNA processing protein Krr1/Pno1